MSTHNAVNVNGTVTSMSTPELAMAEYYAIRKRNLASGHYRVRNTKPLDGYRYSYILVDEREKHPIDLVVNVRTES